MPRLEVESSFRKSLILGYQNMPLKKIIALISKMPKSCGRKEINKEGIKHDRIISCLLQIHIASEETKFGFSIEEAGELLKSEALNELKKSVFLILFEIIHTK